MSQNFPDGSAAKAALRRHALTLRGAIIKSDAHSAALLVAEKFLSSFPLAAGTVVAGYGAIGGEVDVEPLMTRLDGLGCRLVLPVVAGRDLPLLFRRWRPGQILERGAHGTRQPAATAEALVPDLVMVPLLAFDATGRRLGYGGGYYDRTLAALAKTLPPVAVGIAFAIQEVVAVPCEDHDRRLDWIVTEKEAREALS